MTPRDEPPDVEWLDDDAVDAPDEELSEAPPWRPGRRTLIVAGAVAVIGVAGALVVVGTSDAPQRRAGPVIPTFSPGNATGHFPVPGTTIAIGVPDDGADLPFDPRTGRARSTVPAVRCGTGCAVSLSSPDTVRAALQARFPDVEAILAQTFTDRRGFVARTVRARAGDQEIRVFVLGTRRRLSDETRRLTVRDRTVVQVLRRRPGLRIAVTVDRPGGPVDVRTVVALAGDRRLLADG